MNRSMKYRVNHVTRYSYSEPVPVCHNLVHLAPRELPFQSCQRYRLSVVPEVHERSRRVDTFGNQVGLFFYPRSPFGTYCNR